MVLTKNPLFPDDDTPSEDVSKSSGYLVGNRGPKVQPLHSAEELRTQAEQERTAQPSHPANPAVNLIREKISRLYEQQEPNAAREAVEASQTPVRSPHQQFMYELSASGKSLAEIQTAWHAYYQSLPDDQKHQVWREFYETNTTVAATANVYQPSTHVAPMQPAAPMPQAVPSPVPTAQPYQPAPAAPSIMQPEPQPVNALNMPSGEVVVSEHEPFEPQPTKVPKRKRRSRSELHEAVQHKVKSRATKLSKHRQDLHSLLFGLSTATIVLLVFMFGFFNEVIIAPFIQPGRATATPIIIDNDSIAASGEPKVIIPKINVEIPVVYGLTDNAESIIENNLEDGVVHYPTTELPGQKGNVAIFGHSSNNIFNKGKYKFAFVLLHTLQPDDTFYLTYKSKVYAYKVISKRIVEPTEISVLDDVPGQTATATLITCDPPGTSLHRLEVIGQQISPNPSANSANSDNVSHANSTTGATRLAGNGPTLWSKFWSWLF
jgi:sortase A